jgi:hypothetical protein
MCSGGVGTRCCIGAGNHCPLLYRRGQPHESAADGLELGVCCLRGHFVGFQAVMRQGWTRLEAWDAAATTSRVQLGADLGVWGLVGASP